MVGQDRNAHALERVRLELRSRGPESALRLLDAAFEPSALTGFLHDVRLYLRARIGLVGRDSPGLQRVLEWLTSEELRAAEDALRANNYAAVIRAAEAAEMIDDRGVTVALAHVAAIVAFVERELSESPLLIPDHAVSRLRKANALVDSVPLDDSHTRWRSEAATKVKSLLMVVAERRALLDVERLTTRYEILCHHYNSKGAIYEVERVNARASLVQLRAQAAALDLRGSRAAGLRMADLRSAIEASLHTLG